jgi:DNA-binding beta-propeller fold protein YncE
VDPTARRAFVLDAGAPAVLSVDLLTGSRTVVSSATQGVGASLGGAVDLAVSPEGDRLFLVGPSRVVGVDVATGDRTLLSTTAAGGPGRGPGLLHPTSVVLSPAGDVLLVTDAALNAVVAIDLSTGERVVLSR